MHSPPEDDRSFQERANDYVFIKEGFSLWAALFGPFWLVMQNMWVEVAAYFGGLILLSIILEALGFTPEAISFAFLFANAVFGLFARDLRRYHYDRRGYHLTDVVIGKTLEECETRFFRNLAPDQHPPLNTAHPSFQNEAQPL